MRHSLAAMGVLGALFTAIGASEAQPPQLPEPLLVQNFEQEPQTWQGLGTTAKVSIERGADNVKEGGASLRFDYKVEAGEMNLLLSPLAPRSMDTLASIRFWIKVNHNASLAFALQEDGGGRFASVFTVAKDQWQRVEIAPEDLVLQVGKDDPLDDDGRLNPEKISGVALLDFSQIFVQVAGNPQSQAARLLGLETGPRTLFLDDLTFSSKPLSPAPPEKQVLDDFKRPQAAWAGVGDLTLKTVQAEAPATATLQADYSQKDGRIIAFAKLLPFGALDNKESLSFDISSKRPAMMLVQLEEKSGGKYNAVFGLAGDTTPTSKILTFADFKPADDSKDDNNRLDLAKVRQLLIIDATGMLGMGTGDNTLRLGQISVK